jgi:hypothetical protein
MAKLGYEVEGRLRGVYSLFLPPEEVIRLSGDKNKELLNKVGQVAVYDDESKITLKDIDILMSLPERIIITLETPKLNLSINVIPSRLNLVLVIKNDQFFDLGPHEQIKFVNQDRMVFMVTKSSMEFTTPDEFDGDEEVDL